MQVNLTEAERKIVYELLMDEFKKQNIKTSNREIQTYRTQKLIELGRLIDKI